MVTLLNSGSRPDILTKQSSSIVELPSPSGEKYNFRNASNAHAQTLNYKTIS